MPDKNEVQVNVKTGVEQKGKNNFFGGCGSAIGWIATIGSFILFRYLGSLGGGGVGLTFLLFMGLGWLAWWFGGFIMKKDWIKLARIINWSNTISWFIPFVGIPTSIVSLRLYYGFDNSVKDKKKYLILGIIGLSLSAINGIVGVIMKL